MKLTDEKRYTRADAEQDPRADVEIGTAARPAAGEPFQAIMKRRFDRRNFLKSTAAGVAAASPLLSLLPEKAEAAGVDGLRFTPVQGSAADDVVVSPGYGYEVLLRWGDSLFTDTRDLDTASLPDPENSDLFSPGAAGRQARQFGYNCDWLDFFPLPGPFSNNPNRGLLAVNHEFTTNELMYAGWPSFGELFSDDPAEREAALAKIRELVETYDTGAIDRAAHGLSIVEIRRGPVRGPFGGWSVEKASRFNRRITGETLMEITGPAAGDDLLKTSADPTGTRVYGTLNNCAGGKTPWGSILTCEENFDQYFGNADNLTGEKAAEFHTRIPLPGGQSQRGWEFGDPRFDVANEPNEAFRFGWVVEIDPYNPDFTPKKRTAVGRYKHEGAASILARDGRVVIYSGDDARFEYVYKFVSDGQFNPNDRQANFNLLDNGTLYAAKFNDDGTGEWLALDINDPVLAAEFNSQAEVLINARRAADLLGATPMDRPEDIEPSQKTGKVYIALTNNTRRTGEAERQQQGRTVSAVADAANPRAGTDVGGSGSDFTGNPTGHIVEITEDGGDNGATTFSWEIFVLCGNPLDPTAGARFITNAADLADLPLNPRDTYFAGFADPTKISPIGAPDNLIVDRRGNLWISTDGQRADLELPSPINDGVYAVPTEGPDRGFLRQLVSGPVGAEMASLTLNPNDTALFIDVQHPGEGGTLASPVSDWPDKGGLPPRPSVIVVSKTSRSPIIGS